VDPGVELLLQLVPGLVALLAAYFIGSWIEKRHFEDLRRREARYFKRFLATLRALVGGRIKAYEPLLDRARREALLRMTEAAVSGGYDAVLNVRLETSRLASARQDGKGTAGVEMLAFGTAIKRAPQTPSGG